MYLISKKAAWKYKFFMDFIWIIKELQLVKHVGILLIYNEASDSVEKERRIINDRRKILKVKHKMTALMHITFNEKF